MPFHSPGGAGHLGSECSGWITNPDTWARLTSYHVSKRIATPVDGWEEAVTLETVSGTAKYLCQLYRAGWSIYTTSYLGSIYGSRLGLVQYIPYIIAHQEHPRDYKQL